MAQIVSRKSTSCLYLSDLIFQFILVELYAVLQEKEETGTFKSIITLFYRNVNSKYSSKVLIKSRTIRRGSAFLQKPSDCCLWYYHLSLAASCQLVTGDTDNLYQIKICTVHIQSHCLFVIHASFLLCIYFFIGLYLAHQQSFHPISCKF